MVAITVIVGFLSGVVGALFVNAIKHDHEEARKARASLFGTGTNNVVDKGARDAIQQIHKALGGDEIHFFEYLGTNVFGTHNYPTRAKIQGALKYMFMLFKHLGLEVKEIPGTDAHEEIVKIVPEKKSRRSRR